MDLRSEYNKPSKGDICFYIFWAFLQLGKGLGLVASDSTFLVLVACGLPFALGKLLLTRWGSISFGKFLALNVIGIIAMVVSSETTYWLTIFCITVTRGVDLKKALKVNLFVRGPLFVVRTGMAILGFADIERRYRFSGSVITGIRYGLGYHHPNTTQVELFLLIVVLLLLYGKKMKWPHYLMVLAYNYLIYSYTDSRTPFVLAMVYIVGVWLIHFSKGRTLRSLIKLWSNSAWVICMAFSAIGCILYFISPSFRSLGTFASRFQTATTTMTVKSLPLFGIKGVYTDLGYVYIIYNGGVILATLFFVGINVLVGKLRKRNEKVLLWALSLMAVFAILEHSVFSVLTNGLLLFLRDVIYPEEAVDRNGPEQNQLQSEERTI